MDRRSAAAPRAASKMRPPSASTSSTCSTCSSPARRSPGPRGAPAAGGSLGYSPGRPEERQRRRPGTPVLRRDGANLDAMDGRRRPTSPQRAACVGEPGDRRDLWDAGAGPARGRRRPGDGGHRYARGKHTGTARRPGRDRAPHHRVAVGPPGAGRPGRRALSARDSRPDATGRRRGPSGARRSGRPARPAGRAARRPGRTASAAGGHGVEVLAHLLLDAERHRAAGSSRRSPRPAASRPPR